MTRLAFRLTLVLAAFLAAVGWALVPRGVHAGRVLAAHDDPVQLTELALDQRFNERVAAREIEAALASGDAELAQSFLDLARERSVVVEPELAAKVEDANAPSAGRVAKSFARGLIVGTPDDISSFAGTALGDLFVFGDVRDIVREGVNGARGEQVDRLVLGLSAAGIAVTAGTYFTLAAAAPARVGLSVVKAAGKTGRIGTRLMRAIRLEKTEGLVRLAGNVGTIQAKAGTRAALDGLKLAEHPKDLSRIALIAAAKGGKTRAVLKLLGRGAIGLTSAVLHLAWWMLWAIVNIVGFVAALKRATERTALRFFRWRRYRRKLRAAKLAPA